MTSRRPYVSTYFSPRKGAADQVVGFIDACEQTLDIAVYSLTHPDIVKAIERAHVRGVQVRLLMDYLQSRSAHAGDDTLEIQGIQVRRDTQGGSLHHKFCVGDGQAVITGSFNWSVNADQRNAENFVILRLSYVVRTFEEEFQRLWELNS